MQEAQPGFETGHVLIANLPLISDGRTPQQVAAFYQEAQRKVSELPGVDRAATAMWAPWLDRRYLSFTLQFAVEGRKVESGKDDLRARFRFVSPGYFATLGIPLLEGHDFTEADKKDSELVVMVSKSVAERLFPGQDALDRHIQWTDPLIKIAGISPKGRRIIGVLADVDDANILPQHNLTIYSPFAQGPLFGASLLVRSGKNPLRPDPLHHENHSRGSCDPTGGPRQYSRRCPHRGSGEQPRECHRVRRVRNPRVSDFRGRNCGRAGIFGELAHTGVRHPDRSGRPAAPDSR